MNVQPWSRTRGCTALVLWAAAAVLCGLGAGEGVYADDTGEPQWSPPTFDERAEERQRLVEELRHGGFEDQAVLDAIGAVPRHEFVPPRNRRFAYQNRPLPIGYGQTISQPFIVAEMTRLLELKPEHRVLEIGTGSGYQAAVLTLFTPHVYSIEIIPQLLQSASDLFDRLGYDVIETKQGDGFYGWPEHAPFDAIIVTAAAGQIPPPLVQQLKPGGRMVIPVGGAFAVQQLMLVTKDEDGTVRSRSLMPVRFVPLVQQEDRR